MLRNSFHRPNRRRARGALPLAAAALLTVSLGPAPAANASSLGSLGSVGLAGLAGSQGTTGPAGPAGPQGETGPAGPQGETGPTGPAGTGGVEIRVKTQEVSVASHGYSLSLKCDEGGTGISGGHYASDHYNVTSSYPHIDDPRESGWSFTWVTESDQTMTLYVVCAHFPEP